MSRRHQIADMRLMEYAADELPAETRTNAIFAIYADTSIYVVLQTESPNGWDVMGMCYRPGKDYPINTRLRIRDLRWEEDGCEDDQCEIYDIGDRSPDETQQMFEELLAETGWTGHVLSPSKNRGRYKAFCRMLRCKPLERSSAQITLARKLDMTDDSENQQRKRKRALREVVPTETVNNAWNITGNEFSAIARKPTP